jgi:hypothetical protein
LVIARDDQFRHATVGSIAAADRSDARATSGARFEADLIARGDRPDLDATDVIARADRASGQSNDRRGRAHEARPGAWASSWRQPAVFFGRLVFGAAAFALGAFAALALVALFVLGAFVALALVPLALAFAEPADFVRVPAVLVPVDRVVRVAAGASGVGATVSAASVRAVLVSAARALPAAVCAPFALAALPAAIRALAAFWAAVVPVVFVVRAPPWTAAPAITAATLLARRDFRREAALRWIAPAFAARSRALMASASAA